MSTGCGARRKNFESIEKYEHDEQVGEVSAAPAVDRVEPSRGLVALVFEGVPGRIRARREAAEQHGNQVEVGGTVTRAEASGEQADEDRGVREIFGDGIRGAPGM